MSLSWDRDGVPRQDDLSTLLNLDLDRRLRPLPPNDDVEEENEDAVALLPPDPISLLPGSTHPSKSNALSTSPSKCDSNYGTNHTFEIWIHGAGEAAAAGISGFQSHLHLENKSNNFETK